MGEKEYLGDGVYADVERDMIVLSAENNRIYLEPEVWVALRQYVERRQTAPTKGDSK